MCSYKHLMLPSAKTNSSAKSQQGGFAQIFILSNIVLLHEKFGSLQVIILPATIAVSNCFP